MSAAPCDGDTADDADDMEGYHLTTRNTFIDVVRSPGVQRSQSWSETGSSDSRSSSLLGSVAANECPAEVLAEHKPSPVNPAPKHILYPDQSSSSSSHNGSARGRGRGRQRPADDERDAPTEQPDASSSSSANRGKGQSTIEVNCNSPELKKFLEHELGQCTPCKSFLNSQEGCLRGDACRFCHLPHEVKHRARPSKHTRIRCQEMLAKLEDQYKDSPEEKARIQEEIGKTNPYFDSLVRASKASASGEKGKGRGGRSSKKLSL